MSRISSEKYQDFFWKNSQKDAIKKTTSNKKPQFRQSIGLLFHFRSLSSDEGKDRCVIRAPTRKDPEFCLPTCRMEALMDALLVGRFRMIRIKTTRT